MGAPSIVDDSTLAAGASKHYDDLGFVVSVLDNDDAGTVHVITYTANCAEVPPPPTNVSVPDVLGFAEADAVERDQGAGLVLGTMTEVFSDLPIGRIVSTSPTAGTSVPPGTAVDCAKSKGPQSVAVPDVVGETYANAVSDVTGAGLTSGSRTDVYSDSVPDGRVISTQPAAGALVALGTAVDYVVSKGAEPPPPVQFIGVTNIRAILPPAPNPGGVNCRWVSGYGNVCQVAYPAGTQPGDLVIAVTQHRSSSSKYPDHHAIGLGEGRSDPRHRRLHHLQCLLHQHGVHQDRRVRDGDP